MQFLLDALNWYLIDVPLFLIKILKNYLRHFWFVYGIPRHLRTLCAPWKRQAVQRKTKGLDFEDLINTISFNIISRTIGAIIRLATILLGVIVELLFIVFWISFVLLVILLFPLFPLLFAWHTDHNPNIKKLTKKYLQSAKLINDEIKNDQNCQEIFVRLQLTASIDHFLSSTQDLIPSFKQIDYSKIHTKSAVLITFLEVILTEDKFRSELAQQNITKNDVRTLINWVREKEQEYYRNKQFWSREQLQKTRAFGKDWAFGFTPTLDTYSSDVARSTADQFEYDVHSKITKKIELAFSQPNANSVLLSGPPGVGKRTLIYFLAKRIFDGLTTPELADYRVLLLNLDSVLSSSASDEEKNATLDTLLTEAHNAGNTILVIENIDKYLHGSDTRTDISTVLSSIGSKYLVKVLSTTTNRQFKETIRANSLFLSSATTIHLEPTDTVETIQLLLHILPHFETKKGMLTYQAVKEIVHYSDDVFPELPQPASSIKGLELVAGEHAHQEIILATDVDSTLSEKINAPVGTLSNSQAQQLLSVEDQLKEVVIGQDHAMAQLAQALKRSQLELTKHDKTKGAFLFLGATGVGKTETAKTLAKILFKSEQHLIRIDCAEYVSELSLNSLIGSADKKVVGVLTEAVKKNPYSVVLLDEIEKAHISIRLALMTIFDEGYLQNGVGERISFRHTVLLATSNAGSEYIYDSQGVLPSSEELIDYLVTNHILKPEFINRFDGVVLFQPLQYETVVTIAKNKLDAFVEKLFEEKGITLELSKQTFESIYQEGYNQKFGARYLERAINRIVVDAVADALLAGEVQAGGNLTL